MGKLLRTFLLLREQAQPSTPSTGQAAWYPGTDHRPYMLNDSGEALRLDNTYALQFSQGGALAVVTGVFFAKLAFASTLEAMTAYLGTASSGTTILDANKNGTTIFTSTKIQFVSSQDSTISGFSTTSFAAGDRLSIDVDSVGATPGSNVTICAYFRRTG